MSELHIGAGRSLARGPLCGWPTTVQLGHEPPGISNTEAHAPFNPNCLAGAAETLTNHLNELNIPPVEQTITCSLHAYIESRRQVLEESNSLKTTVGGRRFELVTLSVQGTLPQRCHVRRIAKAPFYGILSTEHKEVMFADFSR